MIGFVEYVIKEYFKGILRPYFMSLNFKESVQITLGSALVGCQPSLRLRGGNLSKVHARR